MQLPQWRMTLRRMTLSMEGHYALRRYAKDHYAKSHFTESHHAEYRSEECPLWAPRHSTL